MLEKKYRLFKRGSFAYVYKNGKSESGEFLKLVYIRSSTLKIGFSVSNKIGKAVARNKIKRRLRFAVRGILPKICGKYQMVFVAKPPIAGRDYADIEKTVAALLAKAGIINA